MTLDGFAVLETEPDFASPPKRSTRRIFTLSDVGQARRVASYPGKFAQHGFSLDFVLQGRSNVESFCDFFDALAGKRTAFLCPSWKGELAPVASILTGADELSISQVNYSDVYLSDGASLLGQYIFIRSITGSSHFSKVESVADGSTEVLTLTDAVAADFVLGKFIVGFLYLVRSVNDNLALDFKGATNANCTLNLIEVTKVTATADA